MSWETADTLRPGAKDGLNDFGICIYWTILDAAFQCGSHPQYSSVGNNTRRSVVQLNIPDQGSYFLNCV